MGKRYLADKEHEHDVSDVTGAAKTSDHKWREYNDLSDIGITKGSETFETILAEMPTYSQLSYVTTGANNQSIYPYVGGICEIKKLTNIYAKITFTMPSSGVKRGLYEKYCDYNNGGWVISGWYKFYNELTPPDASDVGALGYVGEMSANDDLNNYKTIGSYTATSAVTATLSNCPFSSGASQLYVLATGGDTNPLLQIMTQSTTLNTNLYVRKHVSNGWTGWKQFAFTDKFLSIDTTASDIGAAEVEHTHDEYAASSHNHSASNITSGTLGVARGGTGATTFTSGAALIGAGTGAVTTRAITNNTSATSAITGSTNLVTMNTLKNAMNRATAPTAADTNYSTAMVRAIKASTTDLTAGTSDLTNGTIYVVYE